MNREIAYFGVGCLALLLTLGCDSGDQIRRYKADKPVLVDAQNRGGVSEDNNPRLMDPSPGVSGDRMLGAMMVDGEGVWFFKMVGPNEFVTKHAKDFDKFMQSVRFESEQAKSEQAKSEQAKSKQAKWDLPASWTQKKTEPNGGMRYATIIVEKAANDNEKDRELTVTRLPLPLGADLDSVLLSNVNRWRGQMQLSKILRNRLYRPKPIKGDVEEARREGVVSTQWTGTHRIYLADLYGTFAAGSPPMRGGPMGPPRRPATSRASDRYSFQKPDSWQPGRMNQFRELAFQVGEDPKKVEITVSIAGGELLPNVNRWRGQVRLNPISEEQMSKSLKNVPVGELTGQYIELESRPNSILVVILPQGRQKLFFKVSGDTDLALQEKQRFLDFVKSFEIK